MLAAIVHYHLRPGGVTRVIRHAVLALAGRGIRSVVLAGAPAAQRLPCLAAGVAGLDYPPDPAAAARSGDQLAARLKKAAARALGRAPDIWHIHNHALGKNPALTAAVRRLAEEGCPLLLQVHDFAEAGRPVLYRNMVRRLAGGRAERLGALAYPQAPHVHYAVINRRDARFLIASGARPGRVHLLSNPVMPPEGDSRNAAAWEGRRRFLYPTRALRRKNVGEILLWAALGAPGDSFALTLAPTGSADRQAYATWKRCAAAWRLPVVFEAGLGGASLAALMRSCSAVVTTSVAEGFGLSFLEPWLAGRPVAGRDLQEITGEFSDAGVRLDGLYARLDIPIAWVGERNFRRTLERRMVAAGRAYGRRVAREDLRCAYEAAVRRGRVDFGRLDESLQMAAIERALAERRPRSRVRPEALGGLRNPPVESNAAAIMRHFGLTQYGRRLEAIYRAALSSPPGQPGGLNSALLLDKFMDPARFFMLTS